MEIRIITNNRNGASFIFNTGDGDGIPYLYYNNSNITITIDQYIHIVDLCATKDFPVRGLLNVKNSEEKGFKIAKPFSEPGHRFSLSGYFSTEVDDIKILEYDVILASCLTCSHLFSCERIEKLLDIDVRNCNSYYEIDDPLGCVIMHPKKERFISKQFVL